MCVKGEGPGAQISPPSSILRLKRGQIATNLKIRVQFGLDRPSSRLLLPHSRTTVAGEPDTNVMGKGSPWRRDGRGHQRGVVDESTAQEIRTCCRWDVRCKRSLLLEFFLG
ncbi:hypothetical protein J1N35_029769 [Gossypium stocksii]|uniref:Uncharacterized protein n=1 Tax=Gossypium stocksii TaxID=47602 RepID=A0A9D3UZC8_9ROSI|nr:hypothetical protein J1N35_029769 [Gossypium stocksii]